MSMIDPVHPEIMVRVALICIIAVITIPIIGRHYEKKRCLANLRHISEAKETFLRDHPQFSGTSISMTNLNTFLEGYDLSHMDTKATYIIGDMDHYPTCSVHGDLLKRQTLPNNHKEGAAE